MSRTFTLPEDDGLLTVRIGEASAELDLYEAHNTYVGLREKFEDAAELGAQWCSFLAAKGLPGLSHGVAFAVASRVMDEVAEFKKKHAPAPASPPPGSPGSTG